jgi:hypothetical protein
MGQVIEFADLLEHFDNYRGRKVRVVFKPQPRASTKGGPPPGMYHPEVSGVLADFAMGAFRLADDTLCMESEVATIELLP